jgi:acetyl esterase
MNRVGSQPLRVHDLHLVVSGGWILARSYVPAIARGTVVWFHGGGWVLGGLQSHEALCRLLAHESECEVVAVEYRLAPEHPFPTPLEDCWQALCQIGRRTCRPLVVGGDSAGGNLAAVCARRARDAGGPKLVAQVLVYPVTDHDFTTASYVEYDEGEALLGRREMEWFWEHYVPQPTTRDDPDVSPLRADELSGLPPAVMVLAAYDPLLDEGRAYADRLRRAGVSVDEWIYGDMIHGFVELAGILSTGRDAVRHVARRLNVNVLMAAYGSAGSRAS